MLKRIALAALAVYLKNPSSGLELFEPNIECTVVKVRATVPALGFDEFPRLYDSINNDPLKSILVINRRKFSAVKPRTEFKSARFERILLEFEDGTIELELWGKPLSRTGNLKRNGLALADVTCH